MIEKKNCKDEDLKKSIGDQYKNITENLFNDIEKLINLIIGDEESKY